jgi:ABC-type antimicrobial peptide transport system permease subunit
MASNTFTPNSDSGLEIKTTFKDRLAFLGRLLLRDRSGMIGLIMFFMVVFVAVFAPVITSRDPLAQELSNSKMPPAWMDGGFPLRSDSSAC